MMHEWLLRGEDSALLLCLLHSCFPKRQMCPNHDSVRPFSPPFKSIISNPSAKRSLKRSLSSPRTTSSQRAGLTSVSCLSILHLLAQKPTTLPGEVASPTSASHPGEKPLPR